MTGSIGLSTRSEQSRVATEILTGQKNDAALVLGEAGIGKSRLVSDAADLAVGPGVCVLIGCCLPVSEALPLLPVVDVLRRLAELSAGGVVEEALIRCPPFVREDVGRLLPEIAERASEVSQIEAPTGLARLRMFDAVCRLVAAVAERRSTCVVFEDIHWADASTLDFIEYLIAHREGAGPALVLTCRSDDVFVSGQVARVELLTRDPRVRVIELTALSEAGSAQQIEQLTGRQPSPEQVRRIHARSEGNPFFTEQLLAAGALGPDFGRLPTALMSLLLARTVDLSKVSTRVLRVLSVARRPVDDSALAAFCDEDLELVQVALADLDRRGLTRRVDGTGRPSVRHALLAEAVVGQMLAGERRDVNAKVAAIIAADADVAAAAEVATHFEAAGRVGEALHWQIKAARYAESIHSADSATWSWRHAIDLWPLINDPLGVHPELGLAELYALACDAAANAGDMTSATDLAEQAIARLLPSADAATAVGLWRRAGWARSHSKSLEAGIDALQQAIRIGEPLPPSRDYVLSLINYALLVRHHRDYDEQRRREALERARTAADSAELLDNVIRIEAELAHMAMMAAAADTAGQLADAALDRIGSTRQLAANVPALITITDVFLKTGELDRVIEVGSQALAAIGTYGYPASDDCALLRLNVFEALAERGRVAEANALVDEQGAAATSPQSSWILEARIRLEMVGGRLESAQRLCGEYRLLFDPSVRLQAMREITQLQTELQLWLGQPDSAYQLAWNTLKTLAPTGDIQFGATLLVLAARAAADAAQSVTVGPDPAQSLHRADELTALVTNARVNPFANAAVPATQAADLLSWTAELARLDRRLDPALWAGVVDAWEALDRPHRAAYARMRHAEGLLMLPRQRTRPREILSTAAAQAATHRPLLAAIRGLARRANLDLDLVAVSPEAPSEPAAGASQLTDRELAVLRLLAAGKSNPQIAAALFISTRTVGVHVTHILQKLRATSRVQAATIAERSGLLTERP